MMGQAAGAGPRRPDTGQHSEQHAAAGLSRRALMWSLALLLVVALAGCGRAEQGATTQDDYTVTFATEPAPATIGAGRVTVTITDKTGQGVEAARVFLEANMNHAGMVPVYAEITSSADGVYTTPLTWTMGGAWYVDAKITLAGGEIIKRRFTLDVK